MSEDYNAFLARQQQIIERERNRWLEPDEEEIDNEAAREIEAELKWEYERGQ